MIIFTLDHVAGIITNAVVPPFREAVWRAGVPDTHTAVVAIIAVCAEIVSCTLSTIVANAIGCDLEAASAAVIVAATRLSWRR